MSLFQWSSWSARSSPVTASVPILGVAAQLPSLGQSGKVEVKAVSLSWGQGNFCRAADS